MASSLPLVVLAALALGADGYPRFRSDLIGVWREPSFRVVSKGDLRPADVQALRSQLDRISEVIGRAPALEHLGAYDAKRHQGVSGRALEKGKPTGAPDRASVEFLTFRYSQQCATCKPKPAAESSSSLAVSFNAPNVLFPRGVLEDAQGKFFPQPRVLRQVGGFPMYDRFLTVIQRDPSRPLYLPVSQERFLRARIAQEERNRANHARRGKVDPVTERRVAALQAELHGLSPAQRAAQAHYVGDTRQRASGLGEPGGRSSYPLVTANPNLLDPALPRTAFQLAIVTTSPMDPKATPIATALLEGVHWRAVLSIMQADQ